MKRVLRVIILMAMLFGTLGLAHASSQVAWAADSPEQTDPSLSSQAQASVSAHDDDDDDCKDPRNKHRPRCNKDKIKNWLKKFCKKHPRLCRSIVPPPRWLLIQVTGNHSVGGLCTLSIVKKDPGILLEASVVTPLPQDLPEKVQQVADGCLLEYSTSNALLSTPLADSVSTTVCFAAPPGKQATLYYLNSLSPQPEWVPLETTADVGKACAPANESGVYVATVTKP